MGEPYSRTLMHYFCRAGEGGDEDGTSVLLSSDKVPSFGQFRCRVKKLPRFSGGNAERQNL